MVLASLFLPEDTRLIRSELAHSLPALFLSISMEETPTSFSSQEAQETQFVLLIGQSHHTSSGIADICSPPHAPLKQSLWGSKGEFPVSGAGCPEMEKGKSQQCCSADPSNLLQPQETSEMSFPEVLAPPGAGACLCGSSAQCYLGSLQPPEQELGGGGQACKPQQGNLTSKKHRSQCPFPKHKHTMSRLITKIPVS